MASARRRHQRTKLRCRQEGKPGPCRPLVAVPSGNICTSVLIVHHSCFDRSVSKVLGGCLEGAAQSSFARSSVLAISDPAIGTFDRRLWQFHTGRSNRIRPVQNIQITAYALVAPRTAAVMACGSTRSRQPCEHPTCRARGGPFRSASQG